MTGVKRFLLSKKFLSLIAIVLCFVGALFLAFGLMIDDETAVLLGKPSVPLGGGPDNIDKYRNYPPVKDRLKQSENAKVGIIFIALGTILQIATIFVNDS